MSYGFLPTLRSRSLILGVAFALLAGCTGYSVTAGPGRTVNPPLMTRTLSPSDLVRVNSVVIAPLVLDAQLRNSLGQEYPSYTNLAAAAQRELRLDVLAGDKVLRLFPSTSSEEWSAITAINGAKKLGADAVLVTRLHRYQEREGTRVAAEQSASVHFTMQLIRAGDGRELWEASYRFEDQALSENLFRIESQLKNKSQPGFGKAEDMLDNGFSEAFQDLAAARFAEFVGR